MTEQLSIHPRNWPGGNRQVKNTAATPRAGRKRNRKMLAKFDARQRAWQQIPANIIKGFRQPGTRKMAQ
jgi:hypothetical protein